MKKILLLAALSVAVCLQGGSLERTVKKYERQAAKLERKAAKLEYKNRQLEYKGRQLARQADYNSAYRRSIQQQSAAIRASQRAVANSGRIASESERLSRRMEKHAEEIAADAIRLAGKIQICGNSIRMSEMSMEKIEKAVMELPSKTRRNLRHTINSMPREVRRNEYVVRIKKALRS